MRSLHLKFGHARHLGYRIIRYVHDGRTTDAKAFTFSRGWVKWPSSPAAYGRPWPLFTKLGENDAKKMNPLHFGSDPADTQTRINRKIRIRIQDHLWLRRTTFQGSGEEALAEVCALRVLSSCNKLYLDFPRSHSFPERNKSLYFRKFGINKPVYELQEISLIGIIQGFLAVCDHIIHERNR